MKFICMCVCVCDGIDSKRVQLWVSLWIEDGDLIDVVGE